MLIIQELSAHMSRHGDVERAHIVIPMQFYGAVQISIPIFDKLVFCFQTCHEVVGILSQVR
jgi:hypothetical protein